MSTGYSEPQKQKAFDTTWAPTYFWA